MTPEEYANKFENLCDEENGKNNELKYDYVSQAKFEEMMREWFKNQKQVEVPFKDC